MAKVYSWSLGQGQYAYIANPNNLDTIYIGSEITVSSTLQKVSNWAQTCTDEEYIEHFNKLIQEIEYQGLDIKFESVESYLNAPAVCDNLRGPAGRGISEISYLSADTISNASVYKILYTDGTYGTFKVFNGNDGPAGRDGKDGADGDAGISTRTVFAFTSGKGKDTIEKPEGGKWDYLSGEVEYPLGWGPNDNIEGPVYQSTRTFASVANAGDSEWSNPMLISGEDGAPGADGLSVEFLYFRMEKLPPSVADYPDTSELDSPNTPDYQPGNGWVDSPQGVDEDWEVEFVTSRKKKGEVWGKWSPASIWSHYGTNGQDGDGIQYIYIRNKGEIVDNPTPRDYESNADYQNKDIEWVPSIGKYFNIDGLPVITTEEIHWTDNPCGVTSDYQFEWVAQRKYKKGNDDTQKWQAFSNPTLWAKYGESGSNGTSIRTLYWCTNSTNAVPPKPEHSVTNPGGEWQTGFPTKYDFTSNGNVVWGITAVIYSHNNEFVERYMMVSTKDNDGNVIPPDDADGNYKDVESIPHEKLDTHLKYIRFNGDYYEWTGGWDGPFLVTGVKGADGQAMDYNTIAFCYAPKDFPPQAPITGVTTGQIETGDVTSENERGEQFYWYDFPRTDIGLDGEDENGIFWRWYQCTGQAESLNHMIKKWGAVVPNTPMDGESIPGKYMEFRFAVTQDMGGKSVEPTIYSQTDKNGNILRYPKSYIDNDPNKTAIGWFTTSNADEEGNKLPEMKAGCTMWQIWNWIDGATNEVSGDQLWQGPTRVSGEKGDQGEMGPIGKRGVTGIPGANYNQMYCLGTETGPYGAEEYKNTFGPNENGTKYGLTKAKFRTWFTAPPSSVVIKINSDNESEIDKYLNSANVGRVIRQLVKTIENHDGTPITKITTDKTYIIEYENSAKDKIVKTLLDNSKLEKDEDGNLHVYVWCVQGNDIWSAGQYKGYRKIETGKPEDATDDNTFTQDEFPTKENKLKKYLLFNNEYYIWTEIEGDEVQHEYLGVEWSEPFRIQGVSGLRGISGSRGQVVYPMGVYNENEVYITTEDKAPYVYDAGDGMFYVLNRVNQPWVGRLPQDYQDITIGTNSDGSSIFKYKYNGEWIGDQDGDTPSKNYANNTDAGSAPAWVRFESFEALYTNIGIIENGMIGSAVYNNEFMFSQQGINRAGAITNYAIESAKPPINSGFLSSYEWVQKGEIVDGRETGRHWKYRGTSVWINDEDVNPYEIYNNANKTAVYKVLKESLNGGEPQLGITPIHSFRPNVCINFKTGEMWTSAGKVNFDADGSGHLLDGNISWDYGDNNTPIFQIGENGEKGIRMSGGSMTIGLLDEYKKEVNESLSSLTAITQDIQNQVDKKSDCYYGSNDPSKDWQSNDSGNVATYANNHLGDLWYNTNTNKSYTFANNSGSTITSGNSASFINSSLNDYYWRESNVPQSVFDRFDGKSAIFIDKPDSDIDNDGYLYHKGDIWLSGNTSAGGQGEILRATHDCPTTSAFTASHWVKASKYTDDTLVKSWAEDGYISPSERESLKLEKDYITKEYNGIIASTYYNSCESTNKSAFETAYTNAQTAIEHHTRIIDNDKSKPIPITSGTGNTSGYGWIVLFYERLQSIKNEIDELIESNAHNYTDTKLTAYTKTSAYDAYVKQVDNVKNSLQAVETTVSGLQADLTATTIQSRNLLSDENGSKWAIIGETVTLGGKEYTGGSAYFCGKNVYFSPDGSGYLGSSGDGITWNTSGDVWVRSLNTKPEIESTKGRIIIENNEINVYSLNTDYNEVLKITGSNKPLLSEGTGYTASTIVNELFSGHIQGSGGDTQKSTTKILTEFKTNNGYCTYRLIPSDNPSEIYASFGFERDKVSALEACVGVDIRCNIYVREKFNNNNQLLATHHFNQGYCYDDPYQEHLDALGGYTTLVESFQIENLKRDTTYEIIVETTVSNWGDLPIEGTIELESLGSYKFEESYNRLDVGADGIRYVISSEAMFECNKNPDNTLDIIMKSHDYGLSVTKNGISITLGGETYKVYKSGNYLGLRK